MVEPTSACRLIRLCTDSQRARGSLSDPRGTVKQRPETRAEQKGSPSMYERFKKPLAIVAIVGGAGLGSYGIASAASGSSSSSTTTTAAAPPGATAENPWGGQRNDE